MSGYLPLPSTQRITVSWSRWRKMAMDCLLLMQAGPTGRSTRCGYVEGGKSLALKIVCCPVRFFFYNIVHILYVHALYIIIIQYMYKIKSGWLYLCPLELEQDAFLTLLVRSATYCGDVLVGCPVLHESSQVHQHCL